MMAVGVQGRGSLATVLEIEDSRLIIDQSRFVVVDLLKPCASVIQNLRSIQFRHFEHFRLPQG